MSKDQGVGFLIELGVVSIPKRVIIANEVGSGFEEFGLCSS
jgi:hypothetical protein